jgi:hypothetical protein
MGQTGNPLHPTAMLDLCERFLRAQKDKRWQYVKTKKFMYLLITENYGKALRLKTQAVGWGLLLARMGCIKLSYKGLFLKIKAVQF